DPTVAGGRTRPLEITGPPRSVKAPTMRKVLAPCLEMTRLMHGFPPDPQGQVTLANWRTSPFNRWAFQHVRELVPSADIQNDPATVLELPSDPVDLGTLSIESDGGGLLSFDAFLDETSTDGLVIISRGRVVFEYYANGMTPETPPILMSVSESLLGLL